MTKTYAQLAREIAALQAAAQKQLAVEAKGAIAKINETIALYGLTAGDLKFASTSAPVPVSTSKKTKATKATKGKGGVVAKGAKFSDGQGNQWGGRGPRPAWLRQAIAAGRTLESFAGGAAAAPMASVAASPADKVVTKSAAAKRIKSGTASAKAASKKAPAAAKSSPSVAVAAPAVAATTPMKALEKTPGKKVAVKAPGAAAAGAPSSQAAKPAAKKSPAAKKGGATKVVRASKATKKSAGAKTPAAGSKPAAPVKKAAAQKAGPARKKAAAKPASRKAVVGKKQAPSAPEALTVTAAA